MALKIALIVSLFEFRSSEVHVLEWQSPIYCKLIAGLYIFMFV